MKPVICYPYWKYDYPSNAEWVPTELAWELREYDRKRTSRDRVTAVAMSLQQFGFTASIIIGYYTGDRTARVDEGNHRVAAARLLGLPFVLARVYRNEWAASKYGKRHPSSRAATPVPGVEPDRFGYVKADLKPSEIGLVGCRPLSAVEIALHGMRVPGVPAPE